MRTDSSRTPASIRRRLRDVLQELPFGDEVIGAYVRRRRLRERRRLALSYIQPRLQQVDDWLVSSRETTNFTYDITDLNRRYLACFVAAVTGESRNGAEAYIEELSNDEALAHYIAQATLESSQAEVSDLEAQYGRRLGWYAIVRITKPSLVVETGVDKGLGACVIAAALQRNESEGRGGRYVGIDINPAAGELLGPPYTEFGNLVTGDAVATLRGLEGPVDVYISDSDHSPSYEAKEYEAVAPLLAPDGFVIADNAHANSALLDFAVRTDRAFLFFAEEPKGHWYPGAGIGVAFPSRLARMSQ